MLQTSETALLPPSIVLSVRYWGMPEALLQEKEAMETFRACLVDVLSKKARITPNQLILWAGENLSPLNKGVKVEVIWDDNHPANLRMTDPEIISCLIWAISRYFGEDRVPGNLSMLNSYAVLGSSLTWALYGYRRISESILMLLK